MRVSFLLQNAEELHSSILHTLTFVLSAKRSKEISKGKKFVLNQEQIWAAVDTHPLSEQEIRSQEGVSY